MLRVHHDSLHDICETIQHIIARYKQQSPVITPGFVVLFHQYLIKLPSISSGLIFQISRERNRALRLVVLYLFGMGTQTSRRS